MLRRMLSILNLDPNPRPAPLPQGVLYSIHDLKRYDRKAPLVPIEDWLKKGNLVIECYSKDTLRSYRRLL